MGSDKQKKEMKQRRKKKEREREKQSTRTQEVWCSHSHAKSSYGMFTPWRCRNQMQPGSLQITAADNKQLFTCWKRAGVVTKVFCQ